MDQHNELISAGEGEEIALVSPIAEAYAEGREATAALPARPRRFFSGAAICVALFAAAFLLCDGFYALRERADILLSSVGEGGDWSELLTDRFVDGGADSKEPIVNGGEAVQEDTALSSVTAAPPQESAPSPDALTPEMLYTYDSTSVPQGMIPIVPMDLSLSAYGESFYYNDTSYSLAIDRMPVSNGAVPTVAAVGEVSVLILHTHATEGYSEEGAAYYDPDTALARANGAEDGVIAVGKIMADILNANGIVTLHSEVMHDRESYKDSYSRAAQTVQSYLAQYPSIRLVIDVHRDSIMTSSDQLVRPVTVVNGEAVAQVMCVVGSNASGVRHDAWQDNLALAVRLRNLLNAEYGNLCRPVYVKKSAYNQQYAPSSLLLEIGSSGNSLAEAERAAALVAGMIVDMMK